MFKKGSIYNYFKLISGKFATNGQEFRYSPPSRNLYRNKVIMCVAQTLILWLEGKEFPSTNGRFFYS